MNKKIKILGVMVLLSVVTICARELRTPINWCPDAVRDPEFLDAECRIGGVGIWGRGFYRTAQDTFSECDGTTTEPLSALWFNRADFAGKDIFANGVVANQSNVWLIISTLSPRFRYTQRGVVLGSAVSVRLHEDKVHVGLRADLPFSIIDVDRFEKCGQNDTDLGGETLDDVIAYKPEVVQDGSGVDRGMSNFAYRLDFLSALPLGVIGLVSDMPFVNYKNTDFPNNPITIANEDITDSGVDGNSPIFVCRSDDGPPSGQFYQYQDAAVPAINGNGSGIAQNGYDYWAVGTDYTPLKSDLATQKTLWIIPGVVQRLHAVDQRPEAIRITTALKQLLEDLNLDESVDDFFARQGVCFTSQRSAGLGDMQLELFANYLTSETTYVEGVFGLTLPTAEKIDDPQQILKMPLGNNGHVETKLALYGSWKPLNWFTLKADAAYSLVLKAQENVATAFTGATIKNIGPTTQAKISWSYFVGDLAMTFLNPKNSYVGVTIGYQFYAKMKDKICFCSPTAKDFMGDVHELDSCLLARRTNVMSHKGRIELFCQTKACDFFVGYEHVFAGKNAMKETSLHLGLSVGF